MGGKLVRNSLIYGGGAAFPVAMSFFLLPLYTRFLSPADYGVISVIEVFCSLLEIVSSLGTQQSLFRLMHDYVGEDRKSFIGSVYLFTCIFSVLILGVFTLLGFLGVELFKGIHFFPYVFMGVLISSFLAQKMVPLRILQIEERAAAYVSLNVADAIVRATLVVVFVVVFKLGVMGYLWGKLLALVALSPVCIWIVHRSCKWCFKWTYVKAAIVFGLPLTPGLACSWILTSSDRFIMERFLPAQDIGLYAIAAKLVSVINLVTSSIYSAYAPYYFKIVNAKGKENTTADSHLAQLNTAYVVVAMFCVFALIVFVSPILRIFVADEYWSSKWIVPILAATQILMAFQGIYHLGIYQSKRSIYVSVAMFTGAAFSILLNVVLVQKIGLTAIPIVDGVAVGIMVLMERMFCKKCTIMEFSVPRLIWALFAFSFLSSVGYLWNNQSLVFEIVQKSCVFAAGCFVCILLFFEETQGMMHRVFWRIKWKK